MVVWSSAIIIAVVGFAIVFVVLALLMGAMQLSGAVLSRIAQGKAERKR